MVFSRCINTPGSYVCECFTGYLYNSRYKACLNINECLRTGICPINSQCTDTDGSYLCTCKDGYKRKEHYSTGIAICVDINECDLDPCKSTSVCQNVPGSYTCGCMKGYTNIGTGVDQQKCIDINECAPFTHHQMSASAFTVQSHGILVIIKFITFCIFTCIFTCDFHVFNINFKCILHICKCCSHIFYT